MGKEKIIIRGRLFRLVKYEKFSIAMVHTLKKNVEIKVTSNVENYEELCDGTFINAVCTPLNFNGKEYFLVDKVEILLKPSDEMDIPREIVNEDKRFRKRNLDFLLNEKSSAFLDIHISTYKYIRKFLWEMKFDEIRPPMLSGTHFGGNSLPFKTYVNSLKRNAYLCPTYEFELNEILSSREKSLFVLGSNFRNEGYDSNHLPEFQMLEIAHLSDSIEDTLNMIKFMVDFVIKKIKEERGFGSKFCIDYNIWNEVSCKEFFEEKYKFDLNSNKMELVAFCKQNYLNVDEKSPKATIINTIIHNLIIKKSKGLTVISDIPPDVSPLIEESSKRYWIFIDNIDVCDIYVANTDLNDIRLKMQIQMKSYSKVNKDRQSKEIKNESIEKILELYQYGIPRHNVVGFSVSRFIQSLLKLNTIKETQLFKIMKG